MTPLLGILPIKKVVYMTKMLLLLSRSVLSDSANPWTAAHQACPPLRVSWSSLKLMSTESVLLSSYTPSSSCCPRSFPASWSFPMNQLFTAGGRSRCFSSASVLPISIQGWLPWGLTGLISLQAKGLKRQKFISS